MIPTTQQLQILTMTFSPFMAQALYVAARLGIADILGAGPRSVESLAKETGAHAPSLARLLRALAGGGIFAEDESGDFALTPLASVIARDTPGSLRGAVLMAGDPMTQRPCGELLHAVMTGEPAFDRIFGKPFFEFLADNAEAGETFNAGMANFSAMENAAIAAAYEFSSNAQVVDVGGGQGGFLAEVLRAHPGVRGVLYDLPQVVSNPAHLEAAGLMSRCETIGGDFSKSVPAGGDLYLYKRILHDWNDATCLSLLRVCAGAMPASGRVLVIDAVLPPGNDPHPGKLSDLLIMSILPGRERRSDEFRNLFAEAGLKLTRIIPTPSALCIVEGILA